MIPTRRLCLVAALLSAAPVAGASRPEARPASGQPTAAEPASQVSVDVSRLRALGLGPTADLVGQSVADELRDVARPGGRVVVRMIALSMNSYAGTEGGGGGGGGGDGGGGGGGAGENDYMEGEVLLVGPAGEILRRDPIVMSLPSNSGGPYYLEGSERRRVIELSRNFARWVRRALA